MKKLADRLNIKSENVLVKCLGFQNKETLNHLKENKEEFYYKKILLIGVKERELHVAKGQLRKFHEALYRQLKRLKTPPECFGGVPGKSVKDNASVHLGNKYIMNLDIKDFFPSISKKHIERVFSRLGCSYPISAYLSYMTTVEGRLPQGFITSPILSVFVMQQLLDELRVAIARRGYKITIWIDDITISGNRPLGGQDLIVEEVLKKYGFALNHKKTKDTDHSVEQVVTGVRIDLGELRPASKYSNKISKSIYILKNYGIDEYCSYYGYPKIPLTKIVSSLEGRIKWVESFDPEKSLKLCAELQEVIQ